MNRPIIYTVGDSHGWHTWLQIHGVKTNYVGGPMTMHSFGEMIDKPNHEHLEGIPLDAIVCFCLGEIDCRCYVHTFQPWQATIDRLVAKFHRAITWCTQGRNPKLIWTYFVVPPVRNAIESSSYPFRGSLEERVMYARYMNKKLKELPYTFVDLYDKYSDEDGCMKESVSDAHVHIENPNFLIDWISNDALYTIPR